MMINCGNRLWCIHGIRQASSTSSETVERLQPSSTSFLYTCLPAHATRLLARSFCTRHTNEISEKNCIHSIKYKYLTETMYLRYLLISNIKSKKWLEGQNQKLSIYINAMYYKHIQFHCKLFLFFLPYHFWTFTVNRILHSFLFFLTRYRFHQILFFHFTVFCVCMGVLQIFIFYVVVVVYSLYNFMPEHLILIYIFFSLATFIFITNCRHLLIHTFRHVQNITVAQGQANTEITQQHLTNSNNKKNLPNCKQTRCKTYDMNTRNAYMHKGRRQYEFYSMDGTHKKKFVSMLLNRFYLVGFQYYCHLLSVSLLFFFLSPPDNLSEKSLCFFASCFKYS